LLAVVPDQLQLNMNQFSRKAKPDSLFLKKRFYSAYVEREKPGLSRTELTKILKELPSNVFEEFLTMFTEYKNRKPFPSGHQRIPVWSKSFQIVNKEDIDPKLVNAKEIMHLWCNKDQSNEWDDEKERTAFSKSIKSQASKEEIKENERIQECLNRLANFIVNHSLEEYTPNLMNHLREQGLYNEFADLALKIYNPGNTSRHNARAAENYHKAQVLEEQVNKLNMLPFNTNDMINGGEYERLRSQREKDGLLKLKNVKDKLNGKEANKEEEETVELNENTTVDLNEENVEEINREILGLPNSTNTKNVNINEIKNENIRTAHGCAILRNSHRLHGLNMNQFFLKNVTDDPGRIINKIRKICFHGVFPFAKQRLSHLGTFVASLKKGAKYHLFEIPSSAFQELITNRDKLQIFSLEDLVRFTFNIHPNEKEEECEEVDRWLVNPKLTMKEKIKMLTESGITGEYKVHTKVVNKVQTGEFSLVFQNHSEAAKSMRILVNHPKFDTQFFTMTWDAVLLKDPVLVEREKEKKEKKKIFTSSYSRDSLEEKKLITRENPLLNTQHQEPQLNFFQKLSAVYHESVVKSKKEKMENKMKSQDPELIAIISDSKNNKNNNKEQSNNKGNKKIENKNVISIANPSKSKKEEILQIPVGNKMQFWNVQYKLVLEALKANSYDSYKTATELGISVRALSKTILTLQSKKYDLYLPQNFKIRVGLLESNAVDYKKEKKNRGRNKNSFKHLHDLKAGSESYSLEDETSAYKKLRKERNIEKFKMKEEAEKANIE